MCCGLRHLICATVRLMTYILKLFYRMGCEFSSKKPKNRTREVWNESNVNVRTEHTVVPDKKPSSAKGHASSFVQQRNTFQENLNMSGSGQYQNVISLNPDTGQYGQQETGRNKNVTHLYEKNGRNRFSGASRYHKLSESDYQQIRHANKELQQNVSDSGLVSATQEQPNRKLPPPVNIKALGQSSNDQCVAKVKEDLTKLNQSKEQTLESAVVGERSSYNSHQIKSYDEYNSQSYSEFGKFQRQDGFRRQHGIGAGVVTMDSNGRVQSRNTRVGNQKLNEEQRLFENRCTSLPFRVTSEYEHNSEHLKKHVDGHPSLPLTKSIKVVRPKEQSMKVDDQTGPFTAPRHQYQKLNEEQRLFENQCTSLPSRVTSEYEHSSEHLKKHVDGHPSLPLTKSIQVVRPKEQPMEVDDRTGPSTAPRHQYQAGDGKVRQKRHAPALPGVSDNKRKSTGRKLSTEEILMILQSKLQALFSSKATSADLHSFCLDLRWLNNRGEIERNMCSLSDLLPQPKKWRMLVYGKPRFGKTELCKCLASYWAQCIGNKDERFQIVFALKMDVKKLRDLEGHIIERSHELVGSDVCSDDELKKAWAIKMSTTLLILDGYDNLDNDSKLRVKLFIEDNSYFAQSCIVLTSRPGGCEEIENLFNIQADICGLSEDTLTKQFGANDAQTIKESKVYEMYGVSPEFSQAIGEVIGQRPKSLYELLDATMGQLTDKEGKDAKALHYIGMFLFARLKERKFKFDRKSLEELLGDQRSSLQKNSLFVKCSVDSEKIAVSHLNLMVYLAVKYLREKWNKLISEKQRYVFLKTEFCFVDSSEEYVTENCNKYFVGDVPEIVFDCSTSLFQMIQDVPASGIKAAFETHSLLFRVDERRLPFYGIREVCGVSAENSFEVVLNMLAFDDLTVRIKLYEDSSRLRFLKFVAVDENVDQAVLICVVTVNPLYDNQIEAIYLDFQESAVHQIHHFLQLLCERFFSSSRIEPSMSGPELVHCLIFSALDCKKKLFTRITLGSNFVDQSKLAVTEIVFGHEKKHTFSLTHSREGNLVRKTFDSDNCKRLRTKSSRTTLFERLKESVSEMEDSAVTICIKTTFKEKLSRSTGQTNSS